MKVLMMVSMAIPFACCTRNELDTPTQQGSTTTSSPVQVPTTQSLLDVSFVKWVGDTTKDHVSAQFRFANTSLVDVFVKTKGGDDPWCDWEVDKAGHWEPALRETLEDGVLSIQTGAEAEVARRVKSGKFMDFNAIVHRSRFGTSRLIRLQITCSEYENLAQGMLVSSNGFAWPGE